MARLLKEYVDGMSLERDFYTSEAIYNNDIRHYWNSSWIWVGHVSQVPNTGDFFLFDYGTESLIIARDKQGEIGVFLNVCRHRGSRGIFEGMIFACTAKSPPDIEAGLQKLAPLLAPFDFNNLKIAHSASYPVPANWKLAVENYMECYHCAPSHKDYARSHSIKDPEYLRTELTEAMKDRSRAVGLRTDEVSISSDAEGKTDMDFYHRRYPLFDGYLTGSKSGEPLAPLLGNLKGFDGGTTDLQIGILNNFLVYSDHVVGYRFIPRSVQETDIEVIWFVRGDAQAGKDYDLQDLTWLWDVTSQDDERIIRLNQEGVNSFHYIPGPLSHMEWGIRAFYDGYLAKAALW
ncbi:MAG: aromatic ring-hydroxylating dioxygenase subunit alpha [Rhodobacteraceae bacterium]|nr:aromatic ring-hydroxylating dioxygenase subunit alpha [Paracoccaceae bacterium]